MVRMHIPSTLQKAALFSNLDLLAKQVVEGFISGIHKSPFHGFSAEFAEHKIYNTGESTKHIDWKLFAKTDKLYTKQYDEETNLRCHIILDISPSMHYPKVETPTITSLNKISFSVLAIAAIMQLLKRQRDAIGLSTYSDEGHFYAPERNSERHYQALLQELSKACKANTSATKTNTYDFLHEISEKMKRRSMVFLFTDMLQASATETELFEALRHLKYNKHEVVLFHVTAKSEEHSFNFDDSPKQFIDIETGEQIAIHGNETREAYKKAMASFVSKLKLTCAKYRITYVSADSGGNFNTILNSFLTEREKMK